jgi:itaconate CoA-transferase
MLKDSKAQRILNQLLEKTDVLVQNLAPGAASRSGLSAKTGYGNSGPYCEKKAYDLMIQAESGLLSITGTPDQVARAGISVADIAAGMYAYSAILAAYIQRGRTDEGSHIEVSMLEALAEWMVNPLCYAFDGQPQADRTAASHPSIYPYGAFKTGDGRVVVFGLQTEREWTAFCVEVLGCADLASDPRFDANTKRSANREQLRELIEERFRSQTAQQIIARLDQSQIANASVNGIADVWTHPPLKARDRWVQIQSPVGTVPALKPPAMVDTFDYRMDPVPMLGQHSNDILLESGYSTDEIEQLRVENVI